jgi:hypothetical protein
MAFRNRPVFRMVAGLHFYTGKVKSSERFKVSAGMLIKPLVPREQEIGYIFEERRRKIQPGSGLN